MELLLGCGSNLKKKVKIFYEEWQDLVTLDINPDHNPDVVADITRPLPFADGTFNEIHAYEVLEHVGSQGDWKFFFDQFSDIWRVLEPGGYFCATVPKYDSVWAWGDPSHKRVIPLESLVFLSQKQYEVQIGKTPMSDFRFYYKADFDTVYAEYLGETAVFAIRKPLAQHLYLR